MHSTPQIRTHFLPYQPL
uniref:Uncharacterized protein n=1 Tax=Rhizophora mucronata TaxID=61149 RepID=A0A2P2N309_RHIMU